ncbi:VTC domain-containing protein [Rozella allomycis CSF55]|uniref:Vacuolar transporter chaperone complex subunit 4 n=1 Tax=Rozella allomycis (strain CSF55) TaxID=988480 RepID=A0A075ARI9_ROZAC|nr:VTC domain-containing protein [Rozella allomycis CSF55]|eukprot:EPZ31341.1 VTC domain-containing protein [Rozella allomycis CSF55]
MKFGEQIKSKRYPEWRFHYMDYDYLKSILKERTAKSAYFSDGDEAAFVQALEKELEKVFDFRDVKGGELTRHVQDVEKRVHAHLGDNDVINELQKEIERITLELMELANFTRLNYTGFIKILKKHDKYTAYMLKPMFMVRLNSRPLYLENLDNLILRLSKLYDVIRNGGQREDVSNDAAGSAQNFVRKTTKYWVHPDNVTELKFYIMKHLPILVFDKKKTTPDPAISSVYYDNDDMELYTGRLEKTEGAIALRLRWYGSDEPQEVFVERKTHREDWTGETSVKSRFVLKEKHVNDFLSGAYTLDKSVEKMRDKKSKSDEELEAMMTLSREIQNVVLEKKLKPAVRTFYNRTAFQLPGDARVRISLDTELSMIREDPPRNQGNWRRPDVLCEYPFNNLPSDEIVRFPYAILEVKLQTQMGQEPPKWVQDLVQGHLVEEVPKFSKFIHGCSTLLEHKVTLFPFWLPQMDVDIRKQPAQMVDETAREIEKEKRRPIEEAINRDISVTKRLSKNHKDVTIEMPKEDAEDESDEEKPLLGLSRKHQASSIFSIFTTKRKPVNDQKNGKKIAVPVRVEPKVFFANERTFLSWVQFSIFLGGTASVFLSLPNNPTATFSAYLFISVAVLFALYALFLYQWRAHRIRTRHPGPYDDRVGPVILVIAFLAAMISSFIFHLTTTKP